MSTAATNIHHPDWQPGKGTLRKARLRAARRRIPFEQALAEQIEDAKAAHRLSLAHNAEQARDTRELRLAARRDRADVFPKPQSVRAVPTGIETSRRRH